MAKCYGAGKHGEFYISRLLILAALGQPPMGRRLRRVACAPLTLTRRFSQVALAKCYGAGKHGGELGFAAGEAVGVSRLDVEGDVHTRAATG